MDIKVEIKRLDELRAAFLTAPATVKRELKLALMKSLDAIQQKAQDEHKFRSGSGELENSVETQITSEWPLAGRVWLNPATTKTESGLSYGVFIHEGTGIYGPNKGKWSRLGGFPIRPRFKKMLRWEDKGEIFFAKKTIVKGVKPDPFIYNAGEASRENVNRIFERHTERALAKLNEGA